LEADMEWEYEINDLAKEESWRMFRIIGELVEGFDKLTGGEHLRFGPHQAGR
jgi:hypothetical protein